MVDAMETLKIPYTDPANKVSVCLCVCVCVCVCVSHIHMLPLSPMSLKCGREEELIVMPSQNMVYHYTVQFVHAYCKYKHSEYVTALRGVCVCVCVCVCVSVSE